MKYVLVLITASLLLVGGCGHVGIKTFRSIFNNHYSKVEPETKLFFWCSNGLPFVDKLESILDHKRYIVLLQNNRELRPSGGFMGSYAVLETEPSGLKSIEIQDIYVPDGQLLGHVDPPLPIQQAFGQGWWKLRDANWDVDFATAAAQIAWFFEQGGEKVDGLIAINLSLVYELLEIIGPVKPVDYSEVTADTFYELAQTAAEQNFFPGSTQKRDFLGAVGREAVREIKGARFVQAVKILKIIFKNLENRNILLWSRDESIQKELEFRDWAGILRPFAGNHLYIVDTNLGANKQIAAFASWLSKQKTK